MEEFRDVEASAVDEERADNAGGDDDTDTWKGAAHGADSEVEEGADEFAYYEEDKGLTRDGDWHEMECVDADSAKVAEDVDGATIAEDERAVEKASNNKTEKSEKAEKMLTQYWPLYDVSYQHKLYVRTPCQRPSMRHPVVVERSAPPAACFLGTAGGTSAPED
ncbi:hypothetical protein HPB52_002843 [Rhipicephalus sanguineus]|uniref:Uncharacterized protein n=1 Tax=Rhipicephalus sanguineus TaxID=34632 RepID=A0A9D4SW42_RHISA|nr:hypothetical protein HPB52_002843 [Rhipicephalus sanguineus]